MPALEAQVVTRLPVERGSCLVTCDVLGAGNGTGDSADRVMGPDWGDDVGKEDRTASTTFGDWPSSPVVVPEFAGFNSSSGFSVAHWAQQMMRRTHSGQELGLVTEASNVIRSHKTNASSLCTRILGLLPTCASRIREAVRAFCASPDVPFFNKSNVFSASGKCQFLSRIVYHSLSHLPREQ
jgi:hypothetical protein